MELAMLIICIVGGAPMVVYSVIYNWLCMKRTQPKFQRHHVTFSTLAAEVAAIQRHLHLADFLTVCVYVPMQFVELSSNNEWSAQSRFTCKLFSFMKVFCFHASSNTVACIALDRATNLFCWSRVISARCRCSTIYVFGSWILAFGFSLPALLYWNVYHVMNTDLYENVEAGQEKVVKICISDFSYAEDVEAINVHHLFHIITIFWLPVAVMVASYGSILCYVCNRRDGQSTANRRRQRRPICQTSTIAVSVYLLCWTPYNLASVLEPFLAFDSSALRYMHHMIVLNSVLNPWIYNLFICTRRMGSNNELNTKRAAVNFQDQVLQPLSLSALQSRPL